MAPFDFATLPRIIRNGDVTVGADFACQRMDGRTFAGVVVKVASVDSRPNDTLVTIMREDGSHRSVYLNDTLYWTVKGSA